MPNIIFRRNFFRKAAALLPVLAMTSTGNMPTVVLAKGTTNCKNSCKNECVNTCYTSCAVGCTNECLMTCRWSCTGSTKTTNDTIINNSDIK